MVTHNYNAKRHDIDANIIAMWAESGGMGKTTVAVNTAAMLQRNGVKTLLVDLNHQDASATSWMGYNDLMRDTTMYNLKDRLLDDDRPISDIIIKSDAEGSRTEFDLIPGHKSLSGFDSAATSSSFPEMKLYNELLEFGSEYDVVIVDCKGDAGMLTDNALLAARNILVPVEMNGKGEDTLQGNMESITALETELNKGPLDFSLNVMSLIPNKVEDTNIVEETRESMAETEFNIAPRDIRKRNLFDYAYRARKSVWKYMEEDMDRIRPRNESITEWFFPLTEMCAGVYDPAEYSDTSDTPAVEVN